MLSRIKTHLFTAILLVILIFSITPNHRVLSIPERNHFEEIIIPPSSKLGMPVFDSGWEELGISPDPISLDFDHNLGGDPEEFLVELTCKDDTFGVYDCSNNGFSPDAHWYDLNENSVRVYASTFHADAVRVRIYDPIPIFDSDWLENAPSNPPLAEDITIKHYLLENPREYYVDLECRADALGVYDCVDNFFQNNANWYSLTEIDLVARVSGSLPDEVRIRIFQFEQPTQQNSFYYDSYWHTIGTRPDPIPIDFDHKLGGEIDNYHVKLDCSDDEHGVYNCTDKFWGFSTNALWYDLTQTNARVYVLGGTTPDKIRLRIWKFDTIYLPLIYH